MKLAGLLKVVEMFAKSILIKRLVYGLKNRLSPSRLGLGNSDSAHNESGPIGLRLEIILPGRVA